MAIKQVGTKRAKALYWASSEFDIRGPFTKDKAHKACRDMLVLGETNVFLLEGIIKFSAVPAEYTEEEV